MWEFRRGSSCSPKAKLCPRYATVRVLMTGSKMRQDRWDTHGFPEREKRETEREGDGGGGLDIERFPEREREKKKKIEGREGDTRYKTVEIS